MRISLNQFLENIKVKTILIFCGDCFCLDISVNKNIIAFTLFGNMVNKDSEKIMNLITTWTEIEDIRQIIFAGHYHCDVIPYLFPNLGYSAKMISEMDNIRGLENDFITNYIQKQAKRLSQLNYFNEKVRDEKIVFTTIMIDDRITEPDVIIL